jgi:peptidoglycan/LPS O-acetylase OafA/YrhL
MDLQRQVHFRGLNTLRFFAAFAIIFYHSTLSMQDKFPKSVKMFVHNLPLGVDLFFIISGFLIVYLLLAEKEITNSVSLSKFYIRRALRIFPLYYLIIGIAYWHYHEKNPEIDFSKYLYFAGNFWMIATDKWTVGILNPLWSICIEEHFYLVIPLLVLLLPIRKIHYLFFGVIALSILFKLYIALTVQYNWMTLYAHTLSRCDLLAVGGLIAYYHKQRPFQFNISKYFFWAVLAYLFLLMSILDSTDFTTYVYAVGKKYLFSGLLVFILIYFLFNQTDDRISAFLKSNRPLNYLGKISFGLYMYHTPVLDWLVLRAGIKHDDPVKPLIATIITIIIAALSYELFEKQILKLKKRFEIVKTVNKV